MNELIDDSCARSLRISIGGGPSTTCPASRPAFAGSVIRWRADLTFEYQQLAPVEWPGLRVVAQLAVPGDDSAERLAVRHYLV